MSHEKPQSPTKTSQIPISSHRACLHGDTKESDTEGAKTGIGVSALPGAAHTQHGGGAITAAQGALRGSVQVPRAGFIPCSGGSRDKNPAQAEPGS